MDRHWANIPINKEHFLAHVPRHADIIAFSGEDHKWLLPMDEFPVGYRDVKELPGFVVYRRTQAESSRTD